MSTVSSSAKPDYTAASFRGALMQDHWVDADDPEHSTVPSHYIAEVARLVHNSISEPKMSSAEPLGFAAHTGLLAAMEIIGTYLGEMAESMRARARAAEALQSMQGAGHE
jgi:hypothetical protein